jgi:hypothetical protein
MRGRLALLVALATSRVAAADSNDLVLNRLTTRMTDGNGMLTVVPQNLEFRALASELGVVLAPHLLTPADTVGFDGFQFTVDAAATTIDSSGAFWRVREGAPNPSATTDGGVLAPKSLRTIGFFARKGIWFPLPSFEVGVGAVHLVDSNTWTGQLYTKLGLAEGYHDLPLPSLAVRGAVSRMMNQRELDLTIASLDVTVSKHLGIGGTWRLDPYVGWDLLAIVARSEVIDATPNIDSNAPGQQADNMLNYVFKDQANIYRHRFLVGAKLQYSIVQITLEAVFALAGSSVDDRAGTSDPCQPNSTTTLCDAKDTAKSQRTLSLSAGFDF